MAHSSTKASALNKLVREKPDLNDLLILSAVRDTLDDRSIAILEGANVEYALEALVLEQMTDLSDTERNALFQSNGALATFSAKARVAHALGLIGPNTRREIDRIRSIRNAFAHARKPISFQTEAIRLTCAELTAPSRVERPDGKQYPPGKTWPPDEARWQYIQAALLVFTAIRIRLEIRAGCDSALFEEPVAVPLD
jgi:hypothetical protein